ncbi:MAG: alpha-glucosidase [Spirochaetia bacterium]
MQNKKNNSLTDSKWWQNAVFYQIYPRSFNDSNGDGIGDLQGIKDKIPYLNNLGIDAVWLNPIYPSPNNDFGYDISNYQAINPEYGTFEDFTELLDAFHDQGMKVIMDLVVNHTSTEHDWFQDSRRNPQGPHGDFYIWHNGRENGAEPPNNWNSFFGGSAWKYDPLRGQYYLHLFDEHQADLNWANPKVREEVFRVMNWWFSRGIDGFRMDVINMISKDSSFPDDIRELDELAIKGTPYFINGPELHTYLKEMREQVLSDPSKFAVGECPGAGFEDVIALSSLDRKELDAVFQMELMEIDHGIGGKWDLQSWTAADFAGRLSRWQQGLEGTAWPANFLSNHDQPRALSRLTDDDEYRFESATLLAVILLSLTGTPFIYYGEEIGMPNADFRSIFDYRDVDTLNFFALERERGRDEDELLDIIRYMSRDNARSPMQWNGRGYGGFSSTKPWIPMGRRYTHINVEKDLAAERSVYREYQKLISLRKNTAALVHGRFEPVEREHEQLIAFIKRHQQGDHLIYANMSTRDAKSRLSLLAASLPEGFTTELEYSNYRRSEFQEQELKESVLNLRPYEACILRIYKS